MKARKTRWRDIEFDSYLEASWAASLTAWGIEWVHHPGSVYLEGGIEYQPDFALPEVPTPRDYITVLLEIKPFLSNSLGGWKPILFAKDYQNVILLLGIAPIPYKSPFGDREAAVWHHEFYNFTVEDVERDSGHKLLSPGSSPERVVTKPGLRFYRPYGDHGWK